MIKLFYSSSLASIQLQVDAWSEHPSKEVLHTSLAVTPGGYALSVTYRIVAVPVRG